MENDVNFKALLKQENINLEKVIEKSESERIIYCESNKIKLLTEKRLFGASLYVALPKTPYTRMCCNYTRNR
jgi:hypothetical protein